MGLLKVFAVSDWLKLKCVHEQEFVVGGFTLPSNGSSSSESGSISSESSPDGTKRTVGDVEFESVREKAAYLTPVPGGVGPMTVAMLLKNTLRSAELLLAKSENP